MSTMSQEFILNDIGDWPEVITDDARTQLVNQGFEIVLNMHRKFKEVFRHQVSAKGKLQRL